MFGCTTCTYACVTRLVRGENYNADRASISGITFVRKEPAARHGGGGRRGGILDAVYYSISAVHIVHICPRGQKRPLKLAQIEQTRRTFVLYLNMYTHTQQEQNALGSRGGVSFSLISINVHSVELTADVLIILTFN